LSRKKYSEGKIFFVRAEMFMYIRKVTHTDRNGKKCHAFKLVESVKSEPGTLSGMVASLSSPATRPLIVIDAGAPRKRTSFG
jgi:hypothetical protein